MSRHHQEYENNPQNDQCHRDDHRRMQNSSIINPATTHGIGGSVEPHQAGGFIDPPSSTSHMQLHSTQAQDGYQCQVTLKLDGSVCGSRSEMGTGVCVFHQHAISSSQLTKDGPDIKQLPVSQLDNEIYPMKEDERNSGSMQPYSGATSTSFDTRIRDPESLSYGNLPLGGECNRCVGKEATRRNSRYKWCDSCDKFCRTWLRDRCEILLSTGNSSIYFTNGQCCRLRHNSKSGLQPRCTTHEHNMTKVSTRYSEYGVRWGEWYPGRAIGEVPLDNE